MDWLHSRKDFHPSTQLQIFGGLSNFFWACTFSGLVYVISQLERFAAFLWLCLKPPSSVHPPSVQSITVLLALPIRWDRNQSLRLHPQKQEHWTYALLFFSLSREKIQTGCLPLIMVNGGCFVCSFTTSLVLPQSAEFSFVLCSPLTLKVCQFPVSAPSQVRQKVVPPQSRTLNVHSPLLFPSQRRSRNWTFPPNCKLC